MQLRPLKFRYSSFALLLVGFFLAPTVHAQEVVTDKTDYLKAKVVEVVKEEIRSIPGTQTPAQYQTIKVEILEGSDKGKTLTVDNDYLALKVGDVFYLTHMYGGLDGMDRYAVSDPYRIPTLAFFVGLFLVCLFVFGGKQGIRGLISLVASLLFISFLLLPGILQGYSPILVAIGVSSIIIVAGSYITHGFNRTTTAAVLGMVITIIITGALAYFAVHGAKLTGYTNEEAVYLNFSTEGQIDFVGLLLGGLMIGLLGVLYDAAISQAIAVEELLSVGKHLTRREVFSRGLRIGREHIGALVNILAIAYVGASLPLLLLLMNSAHIGLLATINQEMFATEILRTMIGSIGLILAVPITTLVAVSMLHGRDGGEEVAHSHHH